MNITRNTKLGVMSLALGLMVAAPAAATGTREARKAAPAYTTYQWVKPRAKAAKASKPSHIARHMRFASAMRHGNPNLACSPSGSGMLSKCSKR